MFEQDQRSALPGGLLREAIKTGSPKKKSGSVKKTRTPRVLINGNYTQFFEKTVSGESKMILPHSSNRCALIIQNKGVNPIYIGFGGAAGEAGMEISGGGSFNPVVAPVNSIYLYSKVDGESVVFVEGIV